ncbi:hypothetical protein OUZ56_025499 [Daphnia magna]|uniref:Uncharacterized protein n=1 Tax=Daphnia magna TaxID=35525 RepID=A0ABQ9ZK08_9CRUS|nr:hypothetical protein OUZ56_025499 [Daphnia magna]
MKDVKLNTSPFGVGYAYKDVTIKRIYSPGESFHKSFGTSLFRSFSDCMHPEILVKIQNDPRPSVRVLEQLPTPRNVRFPQRGV